MISVKTWLQAFRLRTLPLAFSSILLGSFLAAYEGHFSYPILFFALLTTLFLQILSNLANDFGDYAKGTDNASRIGPQRTLQAGLISPSAMRYAMIIVSLLAFLSGIFLLYLSGIFSDAHIFMFFLLLGLLCILAAITYTVGKNAYGYKGFGDISVLVFFGFVGVLGTHYLMAKHFVLPFVLPACACGLLAVGVLNLNNLRDLENDKASGKNSIPVLIGFEAGKRYHFLIVAFAFLSFAVFDILYLQKWGRLAFLLLIPFYVFHIYRVYKTTQHKELDKFLKQLALTSLFSTCLLGLSIAAN